MQGTHLCFAAAVSGRFHVRAEQWFRHRCSLQRESGRCDSPRRKRALQPGSSWLVSGVRPGARELTPHLGTAGSGTFHPSGGFGGDPVCRRGVSLLNAGFVLCELRLLPPLLPPSHLSSRENTEHPPPPSVTSWTVRQLWDLKPEGRRGEATTS